jgi:hypothetical protein
MPGTLPIAGQSCEPLSANTPGAKNGTSFMKRGLDGEKQYLLQPIS